MLGSFIRLFWVWGFTPLSKTASPIHLGEPQSTGWVRSLSPRVTREAGKFIKFVEAFYTKWLCWWLSGKESTYKCRRHRRCGFNSRIKKIPWSGNGNPRQYSCLENSMNRGAGRLQSMGSQRVGHNWAHTHKDRQLVSEMVRSESGQAGSRCLYYIDLSHVLKWRRLELKSLVILDDCKINMSYYMKWPTKKLKN